MTDLDTLFDKEHNFAPISISCPHLCVLCDDYIVSANCNGARCCLSCGGLFHAICAQWVDRQKQRCSLTDASGDTIPNLQRKFSTRSIVLSNQPLVNWTGEQVIQWLIVTGFSRYCSLFRSGNINGEVLSLLLTPPTPLNEIKDSICRRNLKRAIMTLMDYEKSPGALTLPSIEAPFHIHPNFKLVTFTLELCCCACSLPILGLSLQGYQCTACGSVFHKICRHITQIHPECPNRFFPRDTSTFFIDEESDNELKLPTSTPFVENHFFGVPLEMQECDSNSIPIFLSMCTNQFEQLTYSPRDENADPAHSDLMVDCIEIYRTSALTSELQEMRIKYTSTLPSLNDLPQFPGRSAIVKNLVSLAQMIKFFLRELPDPVIPSENYDQLMKLVSTSSETRHSVLEKILKGFPQRNLATLQHVMKHISFIWYHQRLLKLHLSRSTNKENTSEVLFQLEDLRLIIMIFSQILLRPSWHDILKSATMNEGSVLEIIFNFFIQSSGTANLPLISASSPPCPAFYGNYIDLLGQETDSSISTDASVGALVPPGQKSIELNKIDLENQVWYWGDVSRSVVAEVMNSRSEGSFLVRDASVGSVSAFTLTERRNFSNNLFRIYHNGDFFGFTSPPDRKFKLVSELINFCMKNHETTPPTNLFPRLVHPVSRIKFNVSTLSDLFTTRSGGSDSRFISSLTLSTTDLQKAFARIALEVNSEQTAVDALNRQSLDIIHKMESASNLLRGHKKVLSWFDLQRERLLEAKLSADIDLTVEKKLVLLDSKLSNVKTRLIALQKQCKVLQDSSQMVCDNNVVTSNRLKKFIRQMQVLRRELIRRGIPEAEISDCSLENQRIPLISLADIDSKIVKKASSDRQIIDDFMPKFRDQANWFGYVSRSQAESILMKLPTGGFLIRPSALHQQFALSVKVANSIQHCLIYCVGGRFGFSETATHFKSLQELVICYHSESLLQHNPLLNTSLVYPAFAYYRA